MTRIALGIEYDGSAFQGWQSQPHGNSVQDALELALSQVAGERLRVVCAGRTDAGVDDRFHARFDAISRSYAYLLHNHPIRPALLHGRIGWHHRPLDTDAMRIAAQALRGEHDFSAFRAAECQAKSPVKIMHRADVRRQGDLIVFEFRASAFLQHMVRNIVGALVYVGLGRQPPASIAELLAGRDRTLAAPTFSPAGLYFADVEYAQHWNIPAVESMIPNLLSFTPNPSPLIP